VQSGEAFNLPKLAARFRVIRMGIVRPLRASLSFTLLAAACGSPPAPAARPLEDEARTLDAAGASTVAFDTGLDAGLFPAPDRPDASAPADAAVKPPPAQPAPPVRLPGACLKPEEHLRKVLGAATAPVERPDVDLDGDGTADPVFMTGATNITRTHYIYVRRGACAHFVGALSTEAAWSPGNTKTQGLFDLEGDRACRADCCRDTVTYTFRFNGTRYVEAARAPGHRTCSSF
jgi:hypothetical protein